MPDFDVVVPSKIEFYYCSILSGPTGVRLKFSASDAFPLNCSQVFLSQPQVLCVGLELC